MKTANCQFSSAKDSYENVIELASQLESSSGISVNWIPICLAKCNLLFALNQYREVQLFTDNYELHWLFVD